MAGLMEMAILEDPEGQVRILQEKFQKIQNKFGDWMKHLDSCLESNATAQLEMVAKQENDITKMLEKLKMLKDKQHLNRAASENVGEEVKQLRTMMDVAVRDTDSLLLQKENLGKEVIHMKRCNGKQKELLEAQNAVTEQTTKELEKAVGFFRDRLGLQLKNVSAGRLQLIFTCIDYKDPSHPYYCFVKITPERRYEVSECTPEVESFQELVTQLNTDNNFKAFVISLRQAFKATL